MNSIIRLFTDGSANNKSKKIGGIGVYYPNDNIKNISEKIIKTEKINITNQTMELLAAIKGLNKLIENIYIADKKIELYTDSKYLINCIEKWFEKWEKNNWKGSNGKSIKNLYLIKKLYYYSKNMNVNFKWVNAHQKEPNINKNSDEYKKWYGNNQADMLAQNARNKN